MTHWSVWPAFYLPAINRDRFSSSRSFIRVPLAVEQTRLCEALTHACTHTHTHIFLYHTKYELYTRLKRCKSIAKWHTREFIFIYFRARACAKIDKYTSHICRGAIVESFLFGLLLLVFFGGALRRCVSSVMPTGLFRNRPCEAPVFSFISRFFLFRYEFFFYCHVFFFHWHARAKTIDETFFTPFASSVRGAHSEFSSH